MSRGKVLFALSGSIACYKACDAISKLVQAGFEVETVATKSALQFVGEATLEGLTGRRVHKDVFAPGHYMEHIHLAKWADLTIVCPASANTLAKLANGLGDDLVSTLFLAHDFSKPYLIAPAMNPAMIAHPATRANLETLRSYGVTVLSTGEGRLACGDIGEGRLLEPARIVAEIEAVLARSSKLEVTGKKILVTSGGTREAIDGVRAITNTSTGTTGARLTDELLGKGHEVVYLHAESATLPSNRSALLRMRSFTDFASLNAAMIEELGESRFDAVIHAAAVSDYSVSAIRTQTATLPAPVHGKIDSSGGVSVELERNPKIVDAIKKISLNPDVKVAAFKLTNSKDSILRERAIRDLAGHAKPDLIVHNDLNEIGGGQHPFTLWNEDSNHKLRMNARAEGARELAARFDEWLSGGLT